MKRKRAMRRWFWLYFAVCLALLVALLLHATIGERVPVTPAATCVAVDAQDVGNAIDRGKMVVRCLEGR